MNINATILGQVIAFAIFVWFCMKHVWPPLIGAMRARQEKIAGGLQQADQAEKDLELAKERAAETLKEAKSHAAELIDQANKRASQIVEEAKTQARTEGDRIKASAQAEIDQEISRAKESLRKQVSVLSVAGAEKILGSSVSAEEHNQMLDQLAAEL